MLPWEKEMLARLHASPADFAICDVKDLSGHQVQLLIQMVALQLSQDQWLHVQGATASAEIRLQHAMAIVGRWRTANTSSCDILVILWKKAPFLCATLHPNAPARAAELQRQLEALREGKHPADHVAKAFLHETKLNELTAEYPTVMGALFVRSSALLTVTT
jgi:hypothetical protein